MELQRCAGFACVLVAVSSLACGSAPAETEVAATA